MWRFASTTRACTNISSSSSSRLPVTTTSSSSSRRNYTSYRCEMGLPDYKMDYFTLFTVSRQLDAKKFESAKLQSEYRKFQSVYHPDQLHALDGKIKDVATSSKVEVAKVTEDVEELLKDGSSYVGSGVATLKDSYRRARYMMHLIGAEEKFVEEYWNSSGTTTTTTVDDIKMAISNEKAFNLTRTCDNAERDRAGVVAEDAEDSNAEVSSSSSSSEVAKIWAATTQAHASSTVRDDTDFLEEMFEFNVALCEVKEDIEPALTVTSGSAQQAALKSLKEDVLVDDAKLMEAAVAAFEEYAVARGKFESEWKTCIGGATIDEGAQLSILTPYSDMSSKFKIAVLKWTYTQNLLRGIKELE